MAGPQAPWVPRAGPSGRPPDPTNCVSDPSRLPSDPIDGRQMDGWMDGCTDVWNFSPFYRTLSPVGAAALLPSSDLTTSKKQGKGTADLMTVGTIILVTKL